MQHMPLIVGDEIDQYLKSLERLNYSPQSIEIYGYALVVMDNYLAQAGISRIGDVTAEVLSEYSLSLVPRGLKTASISVYIRAVRGLFRFLESQRRIFINPAAGRTCCKMVPALSRFSNCWGMPT